MSEFASTPILIRSFQLSDARICRRLYLEGLIGGSIAPNDTGLDIDDIPTAYMSSPGGHFWVAENEAGEVVGMIGVQQHEPGVGEIRRLRVRRDHRRRGIGSALLERALRFCQDRQYLKVTLDTYMDRDAALRLFSRFHFRLERTRQVGDKTLLYFYLDLYTGEARQRRVDEAAGRGTPPPPASGW